MDRKACLTSSVWLQFLPKRMFSTCELCREYGIKKTKTPKIIIQMKKDPKKKSFIIFQIGFPPKIRINIVKISNIISIM